MQADFVRPELQVQLRRVLQPKHAALAPPLSVLRKERVVDDAEKPCLEVAPRLKRAEAAKGEQRSILHQVLSVVAIAREVQRDTVRRSE
jgi:hypothetical protein